METEDETGEAVGTQNNARLELLKNIANSSESKRVQDGEFDEAPADETEVSEQKEVTEEPEQPEEPKEPQVKKFKIKVNGRELELTEDELVARAQKIEAADEYLHNAKEAFKKTQASVPDPVKQETSDEDDLALVRAIQMGTEEEAVQAIRKLKSNPSRPDDLARLVDERLTFQEAARKFETEYSDILSDPMLKRLAIQRDAEMTSQGDNRPYFERYSQIGNELREWAGKMKEKPKANDKLERKSNIVNINTANVKAQPVVDEEPDDSPSTVIAQMAKRRGQNI